MAAKEMIAEYDPLYSLLAHPEMPEIESPKVKTHFITVLTYIGQALPEIQFTEYLSFSDIVDQVPACIFQ